MERLTQLLKQIRAFWASLSNTKRIALVALTMSVLVGVTAISVFGSREHYTFLFTELTSEDAAAVAGKLKELKVPFQVEAGGSAILVPEERVHELRLELAGAGLPRGGGVGFEIFDKSRLGATEFEQRIFLRRALEGELSRTISTIGAVQGARVHLVLPEQSVFAVGKQPASASVVLRLRPGRTFSKGEVRSVVHLVTAAVPGLSADHVSVISADGVTLHRPKSDAADAGGSDTEGQAEREREVATFLEEQARAIVERVVGAGKADVRVSVALDTSAKEKTEEHYEPTKTALRSEQKTEERNGAEGASVAGVPGAQSNRADTTQNPVEGPGGGGGWRTSWTRNWEVDRVTQKTSMPAGGVARVSVAVLVDGTYSGDGASRKFTPRDKAEMDRLAELVKGAIGFNAARGDSIQIESAAFTSAEAQGVEAAAVAKKPWWLWAAVGAAVVTFLALVALVVRRKRKAAAKRVEIELAEAEAKRLEGKPTPAGLPRAGPEVERVRERALEIALQDPATAAIIVREWLSAAPATQPVPPPAKAA